MIVSGRIADWKEGFLSQAGKEILLKSVVMALPVYAMSCCKLPKEVCKKMARFWQGQEGDSKRIHWLNWDKLSEPKYNGRLGFRDLMEFNVALLAKQLWRIITGPNLLMSRILKARYFQGE